MSSAICQNFIQNAWKKELCSNCFKSKDEHVTKPKPKPIQFIATYDVTGILKNEKKAKSNNSVCFMKNLTEVIGYGGDDWCSDQEDDVDNESSDGDGSINSDDEETSKELEKITKENTDFNTTSLGDVELKKTYTQLLLGKPLVDASGKKQTLLVSVTPFGEDNSSPVRKYTVKNFSHIPIAKATKDVIPENKTNNVVLTSYTKNSEETSKEEKSLLDEISETLENSKNPIQIMSKKKTKKDINDNNKENKSHDSVKSDLKIVDTEHAKPQNKLVVTERKISLTRTPALKRDIEKPVIYQTSTATIELLNSKNLKLNKDIVNNSNDNNSLSNEVNNNEQTQKEETKSSENNTISSKTEVAESKIDLVTVKLPMKDKISASPTEKSFEDKVLGLPPPIPAKNPMLYSREQAGRPDGKEDPLPAELPPLPVTPPPVLETQTSFLHSAPPPIYEKPKIPSKPATMMIRKMIDPNSQIMQPQPLSTFQSESSEKGILSKQDSTDADPRTGKRRAPLPPEETINTIYARSLVGAGQLESVNKEKDKRERASSCAPKLSANIEEDLDNVSPEPAPRKTLSISTDCLVSEEKRKHKGRFSLKKFLRMGSSKDITKMSLESPTAEIKELPNTIPQAKPRLVIVHPCELNGAKVEVVPKTATDQVDSQSNGHDYSSPNGEYEAFNSSKMTKPPPPPRNYSEMSVNKPYLPHPPKPVDLDRQISRSNSNSKKTETVYANIGEVRSAIVPNKPVRTASMREREAMQQKQVRKNPIHNYEPINIRNQDPSSHENVYDYINSTRSSSPDSDSSRGKGSPKCKIVRLGKRSESSIDVSGEYFKYGNIPRSMSLTYCGSETESEIYSPYGFYGSESEVTEDDHDWIQNGRTHKLRSRKGRSIVHKNLEDNYGAVVVANHEALAQVLENIQQTNHIPPVLRGLKTAPNLRWSDFQLKIGPAFHVGRRAFHQAMWGTHHVTLVVNAGVAASGAISGLGTFNLQPITEFSDLVPSSYLTSSVLAADKADGNKQVQATVTVLPWLQINTIHSYSELIKSKIQNYEETWKDSNFVMLQLVNALKSLQAQGIEELPVSLDCFILYKDMDKDSHHRLSILQGLTSDAAIKTNEEKFGTLCMCALKALNILQTSPKITPLLQSLLSHERAVSLTQVKSILEFSLWGPSDVSLGSTIRERELALQRWLDLQRATVLHGLVCARVQLTVYEECHLLFLVRSNTRMMCDASLLIESSNMKHSVNNNNNVHK